MEKTINPEAPIRSVTSDNTDLLNDVSSSDDEIDIYKRFSNARKTCITFAMALCGLMAAMASMNIIVAIPEVAVEFQTTGSIINISNALYMVFMGLSALIWGPLSELFGRRWICISSALLFTCFSTGTALAPNLGAYFVFRMLTALEGTAFFIIGSSCISDLYQPTERATALGWFLSGTLKGPAFGPLLGGVLVTFSDWRTIFWFQTAFGGFVTLLVIVILPETTHKRRADEFKELKLKRRAEQIWEKVNPLRTISLYRHLNLSIVGLASSSLIWNQQSLLTPVRYVLNPRFHLSTPLQSGLFFLAPGAGYLVGTFFGGRWADRTVQKWIARRNGERVPEDRLRSSLVSLGVLIPASILIYGWALEKEKGGIPLPVICMFVQGFAQMMCFPSLNTYCLDVFKGRSSEVIATAYLMRYCLAAIGTAFCLPAIQSIGVGWFSTITSVFVAASAGLVCLAISHGAKWRKAIPSGPSQNHDAREKDELSGQVAART